MDAGARHEAKPTEADFSPRAVEHAVRNEVLQHPLTILPTAGAVGFGLWSLAVGLGPVSVVGMLGLVFVGGVSAAYQYLIRGEDHAKRYVEGQLALRRQFEAQQVQDLIGDCQRAGFDDGVTHLSTLRTAYQGFEGEVKERDGAETFRHLGRDAFHEGIAAVRRALEIEDARQGMDVARLGQKRDRLRARTRAGSVEDSALAREIAATSQRIDRHRELGELTAELLARATEIEAALENVRLDLAAQGGQELADGAGGSGVQLATALEAARRVQARALGRERRDPEADAEYLQAGRRERTEKEGSHGG